MRSMRDKTRGEQNSRGMLRQSLTDGLQGSRRRAIFPRILALTQPRAREPEGGGGPAPPTTTTTINEGYLS